MTKVRHLPNKIRSQELEFSTPHQQAEQYWDYFLTTELGGLYQAIPWTELSKHFRAKGQEQRGQKPAFELQGKIALQFLKSYSGLSDED